MQQTHLAFICEAPLSIKQGLNTLEFVARCDDQTTKGRPVAGILRLIVPLCVVFLAACDTSPQQTAEGVRIIRSGETNAVRTVQVDQINAFRASRSLPPVQLSSRLTAAAATHARDMSVQRRAWHFGSDGTSPRDRAQRAGFVGTVLGENISESFDDEFEVFQSWLGDPVTRQVMLEPGANRLGIAWYQETNGKLWWVQLIGQSGAVAPTAPTPGTPGL